MNGKLGLKYENVGKNNSARVAIQTGNNKKVIIEMNMFLERLLIRWEHIDLSGGDGIEDRGRDFFHVRF